MSTFTSGSPFAETIPRFRYLQNARTVRDMRADDVSRNPRVIRCSCPSLLRRIIRFRIFKLARRPRTGRARDTFHRRRGLDTRRIVQSVPIDRAKFVVLARAGVVQASKY